MNNLSQIDSSSSTNLQTLGRINPTRTRHRLAKARHAVAGSTRIGDFDSRGGVELVQVNADYNEAPTSPLGWSDDDKIAARAQRTVLVVDDDQAIREALSDILSELGYDVAVAGDGQQALDCLRQGCNPYVILLDLGMPVMDGWQFRRELLQDPRFAGLNVVVITAARDQRVDSLQVTDVLTKPVQLERLLEILETKGENS